jgi:hypothetical protein
MSSIYKNLKLNPNEPKADEAYFSKGMVICLVRICKRKYHCFLSFLVILKRRSIGFPEHNHLDTLMHRLIKQVMLAGLHEGRHFIYKTVGRQMIL